MLDTKKANEAGKVTEAKETVTFDDFIKIDIRTATIIEAEKKFQKTKKLLKLKVDTGLDERTVVSGIAEHYKPEEIIGKKSEHLNKPGTKKNKRYRIAGHDFNGREQRRKTLFYCPY